METGNDQCVGINGKTVFVMYPKQTMSIEEAVRHACWLLVLAGKNRSYIAQQMAAIENT
jgi:hypothetical protein